MSERLLANYLQRYESLTPSEFEDMVAEWLRCKGFSDVIITARGGDMGRDVISVDAHATQVYTEVKFHEKFIDRPVIQKLHSIMTRLGIEKGMVVSASNFSKGAVDYASATSIDLIEDQFLLNSCTDIASPGSSWAPECVHCSPSTLSEATMSALPVFLFSYPRSPRTFVSKISISEPSFDPNVLVNFSALETFTTDGKYRDPIYRIEYDNCWVTLEDGSIYKKNPYSINTCTLIELQEAWKDESRIISTPTLTAEECTTDTQKRKIQRLLSRSILYYGRNNHRYIRECVLNDRNIRVIDFKRFWNTRVTLNLTFGGVEYVFHSMNNMFQLSDMPKRIICNDCGQVLPISQARVCRQCGKMVCQRCTALQRYLLFFCRYWCTSCYVRLMAGEIRKKSSEEAEITRRAFKLWKRYKIANTEMPTVELAPVPPEVARKKPRPTTSKKRRRMKTVKTSPHITQRGLQGKHKIYRR